MAAIGKSAEWARERFKQVLEDAHAFHKLTQIIAKTKNESNLIRAIELCCDRAFGKPLQTVENIDGNNRVSTEILVTTIRELREEITTLRERAKVEAGQQSV